MLSYGSLSFPHYARYTSLEVLLYFDAEEDSSTTVSGMTGAFLVISVSWIPRCIIEKLYKVTTSLLGRVDLKCASCILTIAEASDAAAFASLISNNFFSVSLNIVKHAWGKTACGVPTRIKGTRERITNLVEHCHDYRSTIQTHQGRRRLCDGNWQVLEMYAYILHFCVKKVT